MKKIIFVFSYLLLTGCVSYKPVISADYQGETAVIADTFERKGMGKANFYYVSSYNDTTVLNAISNTDVASSGKGSVIHAQGASRKVPITTAKLKLVGQVHHSAPIGYMFNANSNYIVTGDITFSPEPSKVYLVKGHLSEAYSAVWLEDVSGNIVSNVVEKLGADTEQGQFEKQAMKERRAYENTASTIAVFSNISGGETSEIVQLKLGKPNSVTKTDSNIFLGRPAKTTFHYDQLGTVSFTGKHTMYVDSVSAIVQSALIESSELRYQLQTYDSARLQHFAKNLYTADLSDTTSLDMVGTRIWLGRDTDDAHEVDALSWFCKSIAKSRNPRYRILLSTLAEHAKSDKLKRYARSSLHALPIEDVESFDFKNAEL